MIGLTRNCCNIVLVIFLVWASSISTATAKSILVMAEDADPSSLARDEQLSQQMLRGIEDALAAAGYTVYDETAITYEHYIQGRTRRSNEELIDIAKHIQGKAIDIVVFAITDKKAKSGKYMDKAWLEISARILAIQSGKVIGNVTYKPKAWSLPKGCKDNPECLKHAWNRDPIQVGWDTGDRIIAKIR